MARIVMKFGGTSTANTETLRVCAARVAEEVLAGHQVAVVVSAPAGMTDDLTARINEFDPNHHHLDEADLVLSSGEQINAGLLAMALRQLGHSARSWTGWQSGFITDGNHGQARLSETKSQDLIASLEQGHVAVLTGFQGISEAGRITTLGRGGSDVSAVALATAINADRCDIYTDVTGVFTADPRMVTEAKRIDVLSSEEMLEMASSGAKVLHTRSVELALSEDVPLRVLSTFEPGPGTSIKPGRQMAGLETHLASGVTYSRDQSRISLYGLQSQAGLITQIFGAMTEAKINVDMIVQSPTLHRDRTNLIFATSRGDHEAALAVLRRLAITLMYQRLEVSPIMAKVSIIGLGLRSQAGMAHTFFNALSKAGIAMDAVATSELRISALITENLVEQAVRALHFAFDLDRNADG